MNRESQIQEKNPRKEMFRKVFPRIYLYGKKRQKFINTEKFRTRKYIEEKYFFWKKKNREIRHIFGEKNQESFFFSIFLVC